MFGKNKKYNILVLGNNGMLGHDLYKSLLSESAFKTSNIGTVIGIDAKNGFELHKRHSLDELFSLSIHFDYCINCVAHTDTKSAETTKEGKELDYKLNALAPKYIAESCRQWNTKLIHISTDYVFSEKSVDAAWDLNNSPNPLKPDSETFPTNVYGMNKLLGEKHIEEIFKKNKKDYCICRVSWLYGMHNNKSFVHKFLKNLSNKLKEDPNAKITMTSNEVSVPTSVQYVVNCIKHIIDNNLHGIFHTVPAFENFGVSRYDFARMILDMFCSNEQEENLFLLNGKRLKDILLEPVECDSYWPKYSAMLNRSISEKYTVGELTSWKEDLLRFLHKNNREIYDYILEV